MHIPVGEHGLAERCSRETVSKFSHSQRVSDLKSSIIINMISLSTPLAPMLLCLKLSSISRLADIVHLS